MKPAAAESEFPGRCMIRLIQVVSSRPALAGSGTRPPMYLASGVTLAFCIHVPSVGAMPALAIGFVREAAFNNVLLQFPSQFASGPQVSQVLCHTLDPKFGPFGDVLLEPILPFISHLGTELRRQGHQDALWSFQSKAADPAGSPEGTCEIA